MTPEQLDLARTTAPLVEAAGDDFARRFYDRLFELHPGARHLFPQDLRAQRGKLAAAWRRLYDLIAETTLEGAAGSLFTAPA